MVSRAVVSMHVKIHLMYIVQCTYSTDVDSNVIPIDHVNFVYNKCYLVHSLAFLAGKILHWSYGKVDIYRHNFHINPTVMKVKAGQVLRCAPFIISKVDSN